MLLPLPCAYSQSQSLPGSASGRPLNLSQTRYRLRAGEPVKIDGTAETLEFIRSATQRSARIDDAARQGFVVGPSVTGELVLAVSLLTPPGNYTLRVRTHVAACGARRAFASCFFKSGGHS